MTRFSEYSCGLAKKNINSIIKNNAQSDLKALTLSWWGLLSYRNQYIDFNVNLNPYQTLQKTVKFGTFPQLFLVM